MVNRMLLKGVNRFVRAMSQYERLELVSVLLPRPCSWRVRASLSVRPWIAPSTLSSIARRRHTLAQTPVCLPSNESRYCCDK